MPGRPRNLVADSAPNILTNSFESVDKKTTESTAYSQLNFGNLSKF